MTVDKMIKCLEPEYGYTTIGADAAEAIIAKLRAAEAMYLAVSQCPDSEFWKAYNTYERAGETK